MLKLAMFDTKGYDRAAFEARLAGRDVEIKFFEPNLSCDTVALCAGYDCVIPFVNDRLDADVIECIARMGVKLIALRCAGYNNVDLDAARAAGITVMRVPAYSPYAIAEHAMAMLLTIVRRTHKAYIRTRDYNFSLNGMVGFDLHGKTVGVVGTGRIGRVFIDICRGFGMHVIAYDAYPAADAGIEYVSKEELLSRSDIISLHCPLTKDTYHMVDEAALSTMKKGVVIVNTSRGALIDAEALLNAIKRRHVGAACLDVYEEEGDFFFEDFSGHILDDDVLSRLISMPNVLVTGHQAFLTEEALDNIASTTLDNVRDFFAGVKNGNEII
ncbi:MAG: 2-hydroxyacid dehydrogenase [Clostridiales bacterium]|nr:2-hydroxyacid dehydrogenase [Clostridiales bacterium]